MIFQLFTIAEMSYTCSWPNAVHRSTPVVTRAATVEQPWYSRPKKAYCTKLSLIDHGNTCKARTEHENNTSFKSCNFDITTSFSLNTGKTFKGFQCVCEYNKLEFLDKVFQALQEVVMVGIATTIV